LFIGDSFDCYQDLTYKIAPFAWFGGGFVIMLLTSHEHHDSHEHLNFQDEHFGSSDARQRRNKTVIRTKSGHDFSHTRSTRETNYSDTKDSELAQARVELSVMNEENRSYQVQFIGLAVGLIAVLREMALRARMTQILLNSSSLL
jgi:hypothetical protein